MSMSVTWTVTRAYIWSCDWSPVVMPASTSLLICSTPLIFPWSVCLSLCLCLCLCVCLCWVDVSVYELCAFVSSSMKSLFQLHSSNSRYLVQQYFRWLRSSFRDAIWQCTVAQCWSVTMYWLLQTDFVDIVRWSCSTSAIMPSYYYYYYYYMNVVNLPTWTSLQRPFRSTTVTLWAYSIIRRAVCLSLHVCLCVNHGGWYHNHYTWTFVILHVDPDNSIHSSQNNYPTQKIPLNKAPGLPQAFLLKKCPCTFSPWKLPLPDGSWAPQS